MLQMLQQQVLCLGAGTSMLQQQVLCLGAGTSMLHGAAWHIIRHVMQPALFANFTGALECPFELACQRGCPCCMCTQIAAIDASQPGMVIHHKARGNPVQSAVNAAQAILLAFTQKEDRAKHSNDSAVGVEVASHALPGGWLHTHLNSVR